MSFEVEINKDFQNLLQVCNLIADHVSNMNNLISQLLKVYHDSYPDFVNSRYFRRITRKTAASILEKPEIANFEICNYFGKFNEDFQTFLKACRSADSSPVMDEYLKDFLKYYQQSDPNFLLSGDFSTIAHLASVQINENPGMVYLIINDFIEELENQSKTWLRGR